MSRRKGTIFCKQISCLYLPSGFLFQAKAAQQLLDKEEKKAELQEIGGGPSQGFPG